MSDWGSIFACPPISYWKSNPYGLDFSPDGRKLAVGTGAWYGHGGVSLIDLATGSGSNVRFLPADYTSETGADAADLPVADFFDSELTVSGVAFDGSGHFLAVCGWKRRHGGSAVFLFSVADNKLVHHSTLDSRGGLAAAPTGVCFMADQLFARSMAESRAEIFRAHDLPATVDANPRFAHRSHARVVVVDDQIITGGVRIPHAHPDARGWHENGLAIGPDVRSVDSPGSKVTAILAHPDGRLITGGNNGELHEWEFDGEWKPGRRLQKKTRRAMPEGYKKTTYRPESVVGLCALDDGRFFSVDGGGTIAEWHDDAIANTYDIPQPGSPRCIAVHPDTPAGPTLAVGVKAFEAESAPQPVGYVALLLLG
jgi:WD40 repeat protein